MTTRELLSDAKMDINLRVLDLSSSEQWYRTMFSVEPIYKGEDRSEDGTSTALVCFRIGRVKVWLLPGLEQKHDPAQQSVGVAFMVKKPLAIIRQELSQRGAEFYDVPIDGFPVNQDGVRVGKDSEFMYILDPNGYKLEFCHVF